MPKGTIKIWNNERGFGFIKQDSGAADIFIHISALKHHVRKPIVGDLIQFEIHRLDDGKERAVNCYLQGVASLSPKVNRASKSTGVSIKSVLLLLVIAVGIGYKVLDLKQPDAVVEVAEKAYPQRKPMTDLYRPVKDSSSFSSSSSSFSSFDSQETASGYSCSGKVHCSQMNSCSEAMFYLSNCPGVKIDGDGDGIPCERQFCGG